MNLMTRVGQGQEDPEELARRQALSNVLGGGRREATAAPSEPATPVEAPEGAAAGGDLAHDMRVRPTPGGPLDQMRGRGPVYTPPNTPPEPAEGNIQATFSGPTPKIPGYDPTDPARSGANSPQPAAPTGWGSYEVGGIDAAKRDAGHSSPKYDVMRILSNYAHNPQGLQQALPAIQQMLKEKGWAEGATITGSKGDKLRFDGALNPAFNGINEFDVLEAAGEGGKRWQWLANQAGGGGQAEVPLDNGGYIGGAGSRSSSMSADASNPNVAGMLSEHGLYKKLLEELQATLGTSRPDQAAISAVLGGR